MTKNRLNRRLPLRRVVAASMCLLFASYAIGVMPFLYKSLGQCQSSKPVVVAFSHCGMDDKMQVFSVESDGSMTCHNSKKTDDESEHKEKASACLLCNLATKQKQIELPVTDLSLYMTLSLELQKTHTDTPHIYASNHATSERGPPLA